MNRDPNKVVVALSGGVDSSVAAAFLMEAHRQVEAATLRLRHPDPEFSASQLCASRSDEAAVADVCAKLGIGHKYLECFPRFESRVLCHAAAEYAAGRTPNPCCDCNLLVKFAALIEYADSIGAAKVATGHYARLTTGDDGGIALLRGDDPVKDQSYFLYRLTQSDLGRLEFPVGTLEKSEVRRIAARHGFVTSDKPDSQDACFQVPGECFGETLHRLCGFAAKPGFFVYQGRIVGRHEGIHRYTVGQRKGLRVALGEPAYIKSIDAETGAIELVTDRALLESTSFIVANICWQSGHAPENDNLTVQARYRSRPVACSIEPAQGGKLRVTLHQGLSAVTPGQAAVFYRGNQLLGGGVIDHAD
ncbi:MAG: tRNA 2-thiouridine(34) synthase MnmA [Victivallaceae bacterium]|nr:tRNA 2-thiouridine(34) synthase MnmA [Victivallaceae bacterium]